MTKTEKLYAYAEEQGYPVIEPPPDGTIDSMAMLSPRGTPCIFFRPDGYTAAEQNERLCHEIGHCAEGAFYTVLSAPTAREKCEEQARRWSYRKMIPLSALLSAFACGETEAWQIAERLSVPEHMVREAAEYYRAAFSAVTGVNNVRPQSP